MRVFELLQQHSFAELEPHLLCLFKVNGGYRGLTQQQALCHWKGLYACLIYGGCILPSDYYIRVSSRWARGIIGSNRNCAVYKENQFLWLVARHSVDAEILGMEVTTTPDLHISSAEFAAGLLWEMSYYPLESQMKYWNSKKLK